MTHTEQDKQLVFNALEPEGCWHVIQETKIPAERFGYRDKSICSCGCFFRNEVEIHAHLNNNPDFSTPEGAFWILERLEATSRVEIYKGAVRYWVRIVIAGKSFEGKSETFSDALFTSILAQVKDGE